MNFFKDIKRFLKLIVALGVLALLVLFLRDIDTQVVWQTFQSHSYWDWALCIVGTLVAYTFQGLRFYSLQSYGFSAWRHIGLNFCNHAGNTLLPARVGEAIRPLYLKLWKPEITVRSIVSWTLLEKCLDGLGFLPFVAWGFALFEKDPRIAPYAPYIWWVIIAAGVVLTASLFVVLKRRKVGHPKHFAKRIAQTFVCSVVSWVGYYLSVYALIRSGPEAASLMVAMTAAVSLPGLPAGMGAMQAAFVWVTRQMGGDPSAALAHALFLQMVQIACRLGIGLPLMLSWGWPQQLFGAKLPQTPESQ